MKYKAIDPSLFIINRRNIMAHLEPRSIAVFNSNDIYPIGTDNTMLVPRIYWKEYYVEVGKIMNR
ncbi:MAG TPA: hypothetical protein VKX30_03560 [Flavobacteriaceae bacterium]|nr:hypothetical protein [Flavobacteriaceae bacterium]